MLAASSPIARTATAVYHSPAVLLLCAAAVRVAALAAATGCGCCEPVPSLKGLPCNIVVEQWAQPYQAADVCGVAHHMAQTQCAHPRAAVCNAAYVGGVQAPELPL